MPHISRKGGRADAQKGQSSKGAPQNEEKSDS